MVMMTEMTPGRRILLWLGVLILAVGGILAYVIVTDSVSGFPQQALMVITVSVVLAGICAICATAR